jgi:hypothetical protein
MRAPESSRRRRAAVASGCASEGAAEEPFQPDFETSGIAPGRTSGAHALEEALTSFFRRRQEKVFQHFRFHLAERAAEVRSQASTFLSSSLASGDLCTIREALERAVTARVPMRELDRAREHIRRQELEERRVVEQRLLRGALASGQEDALREAVRRAEAAFLPAP